MNTCDTCKHWHRRTELEEDEGSDLVIFGECHGNKFTLGYPEGDEIVPSLEDGEMEFLTGPKFGCIKWEAE